MAEICQRRVLAGRVAIIRWIQLSKGSKSTMGRKIQLEREIATWRGQTLVLGLVIMRQSIIRPTDNHRNQISSIVTTPLLNIRNNRTTYRSVRHLTNRRPQNSIQTPSHTRQQVSRPTVDRLQTLS